MKGAPRDTDCLSSSERLNSLVPNQTAPYNRQRLSSESGCKEEPDGYYKKVSRRNRSFGGRLGSQRPAGRQAGVVVE